MKTIDIKCAVNRIVSYDGQLFSWDGKTLKKVIGFPGDEAIEIECAQAVLKLMQAAPEEEVQ